MCDSWLPDALVELLKSKLTCVWKNISVYLKYLITEDACILMAVLVFAQLFCVLKYHRILGDTDHLAAETSPSSETNLNCFKFILKSFSVFKVIR